eukprot:Gb_25497 [translate_table: standard]
MLLMCWSITWCSNFHCWSNGKEDWKKREVARMASQLGTQSCKILNTHQKFQEMKAEHNGDQKVDLQERDKAHAKASCKKSCQFVTRLQPSFEDVTGIIWRRTTVVVVGIVVVFWLFYHNYFDNRLQLYELWILVVWQWPWIIMVGQPVKHDPNRLQTCFVAVSGLNEDTQKLCGLVDICRKLCAPNCSQLRGGYAWRAMSLNRPATKQDKGFTISQSSGCRFAHKFAKLFSLPCFASHPCFRLSLKFASLGCQQILPLFKSAARLVLCSIY